MESPRFTHLHVHTDASLQDGLTPVSTLVQAAAGLGFDHLAMTDHGSLANAVAFTLECKEHNIKPILGLEAYLAYRNDGKERIGHVTLLADGNKGFENIVKLNNLGHASDYKQPAFTVQQLIDHSDHVVLLTGCQASPFHNLSFEDAVALGAKLKPYFKDRMYLEVMFISHEDKTSRYKKLRTALGLPMVITNDVHMPLVQHTKIHNVLTRMRAGFEYDSSMLYLKRPSELKKVIKGTMPEHLANEAMENAWRLAESLEPVELAARPQLPHVSNEEEWLALSMIQGLKDKGLLDVPGYEERVTYEFSIIKEMGYCAYFFILHDLVQYARRHDVRIGPGRGSGAGSLILYALGITDIDPLKHDLSFERFLNPEREGMPDVDMDFEAERRDIVIEYAKSKWGAFPIATYSRYSHKILTHDLARQMRVPRRLDEDAADGGPESEAFGEILEKYKDFGLAYQSISGQIRHRGTHAGGVVITDRIVPIERSGSNLAISWVEGLRNELSYAGFVKFDLLGLAALSAIRRLEEQLGTKAPWPAPDNDPVFELFQKGRLAGIFQFAGSQGIRSLTRKLEPNKFEDLVAINALYRPGALDVGATDMYPEWKKKPRKVHPVLHDILEPTYGAIVYQEQVMAIYSRITGGSLGEADLARRIIVKSKEHDLAWVKKFTALKEKFMDAAKDKHKMTPAAASKLWDELAAHSRYSFNKAHAVSYARIAWEMAWFKYHYPAEFYAAMLNIDAKNTQLYIVQAIVGGIEVVMPHINVSGHEYVAKDGAIYMPLAAVKFLSGKMAERVVEERNTNGDFTGDEDFMKRIPKKVVQGRARKGLYTIGAFRGLPSTPEGLAIDCSDIDMEADVSVIQRQFMGIFIPKREELDAIKRSRKEGKTSGILASKETRTSGYGPYEVLKLIPEGVFWVRGIDMERFAIGDLVEAVVNENSGRATKLRKISL